MKDHDPNGELVLVSPELLDLIAEHLCIVSRELSASHLQIISAIGYLTGSYSASAGIAVRIQEPPNAPDGLEPLALGYHTQLRAIRLQVGGGSA